MAASIDSADKEGVQASVDGNMPPKQPADTGKTSSCVSSKDSSKEDEARVHPNDEVKAKG